MWTEHGVTGPIAWYSSGSPAQVMLLHGYTDSAACWLPTLPVLDGRAAIATDARGHGRSGMPAGTVTVPILAGDAAAVLDDVGPGRPVVVMGHSMGASTAAELARVRPDLVSALILEDPPAPADPQPGISDGIPDDVLEIQRLDVAARIARRRIQSPRWPDAEYEPWAVSKGQVRPRHFQRSARPLAELIAGSHCPVLLIRGEPTAGSLVSDEAVDATRAAIGDRLCVVHCANAGHNVRREAPEAFAEAVRDFLPDR